MNEDILNFLKHYNTMKEKQEYVLVPIEWLDQMNKDVKRISELLDTNGYDISHKDIHYPIVGFIGFCKSVSAIITHNKRIVK